jgi:hypothetical protein
MSGDEDQDHAKVKNGDQFDTDEDMDDNPFWSALLRSNDKNASNVTSDEDEDVDEDDDDGDNQDTVTDPTDASDAEAPVAPVAPVPLVALVASVAPVPRHRCAATAVITFEDVNNELRQLWVDHLRLRALCALCPVCSLMM